MFFPVILDFIEDPNESENDVHRNTRVILNKDELTIDGLIAIGAVNTNTNMGDQYSGFPSFRNEKPNALKGNLM